MDGSQLSTEIRTSSPGNQNILFISRFPLNHLHDFRPCHPYPPMLRSNWKEVVRTTRTTPTVFLLASKRCSIEVVLTSRKPLKASRWFPYVEETGGKIFRSNG